MSAQTEALETLDRAKEVIRLAALFTEQVDRSHLDEKERYVLDALNDAIDHLVEP